MSNNDGTSRKAKKSGHSIMGDLILGVCLLATIVSTMVILAAIVTDGGLKIL